MQNNIPTPAERDARRDAARERLTRALDPQTARERYMVDWLVGCLIADEADEWSVMVERAHDADQMDLKQLGDVLQRVAARVDQLRDAELDVLAEFDANRASK